MGSGFDGSGTKRTQVVANICDVCQEVVVKSPSRYRLIFDVLLTAIQVSTHQNSPTCHCPVFPLPCNSCNGPSNYRSQRTVRLRRFGAAGICRSGHSEHWTPPSTFRYPLARRALLHEATFSWLPGQVHDIQRSKSLGSFARLHENNSGSMLTAYVDSPHPHFPVICIKDDFKENDSQDP